MDHQDLIDLELNEESVTVAGVDKTCLAVSLAFLVFACLYITVIVYFLFQWKIDFSSFLFSILIFIKKWKQPLTYSTGNCGVRYLISSLFQARLRSDSPLQSLWLFSLQLSLKCSLTNVTAKRKPKLCSKPQNDERRRRGWDNKSLNQDNLKLNLIFFRE